MKKRTMKILATVMCFITVFCMVQAFAGAAYIENSIGIEEEEVLVIDVTNDEFLITAEETPSENDQPDNPQGNGSMTFAQILEMIIAMLIEA